jgi:hypothetical protein
MATKLVPEFVIGMALTPPMVMAISVLKFAPLIVINDPTEPEEGENEEMVGAGGLPK